METLFGIVGRDFVLTACDTAAARSILLYKSDEDKSRALSDRSLMLYSGESGDTVQFAEYIQKNIKLYELKNSIKLSPAATAHYVRGELATSLRSRNPYMVNVLIAGYDDQTGPELYWIDYLGAMNKIPFGAHGYGAHFTLGTMDRNWEKDLSLDEAKELLRKCLLELKTRFLINLPGFNVKVVDKTGIHQIQL